MSVDPKVGWPTFQHAPLVAQRPVVAALARVRRDAHDHVRRREVPGTKRRPAQVRGRARRRAARGHAAPDGEPVRQADTAFAAFNRSGVNGTSRSRTPVASKIALASAAKIGAAAGSPAPTAPSPSRPMPRVGKPSKALLFLKKKKQKDFPLFAPAPTGSKGEKFFGSFFQKGTFFLASWSVP